MELMQAIMGRRSVRSYTPEAVSREDLDAVLEAARWAPSWANTQCWELIVVEDAGIRQELARTLPEKNPARGAVAQAPVVIAACARTGVAGFFKGQAVTDKGDWLLFDVALALQNLTLAAHARGLGTVHVGFFDSRQAGDILKVPEGLTVVELMPLGHPAATAAVTPRTPLRERVSYNRYGHTR
jgi:nitroreductase